MIRGRLRSALLTLSSVAATSPIEAITATFILVTLTYFQLLHAIKGSEFFHVPETSPPPKPIHLVRLSHPPLVDEAPYILPSPPSPLFNSFSNSNTWRPLPIPEFRKVLEANALEGGYVFPSDAGGNEAGEKASVVLIKQLAVVREDGRDSSSAEWERWLLHDVGVEVGGERYTYQDLCFECNTTLTPHPLHSSQSTLTLYFNPPTPDTPTLTYLNHISRLPAFTPPGSNTTFRILPPAGGSWGILPSIEGAGLFSGLGKASSGYSEREEEDYLSGLKDVRWFAYAVRAFVMRFVTLAKVSASPPSNRLPMKADADQSVRTPTPPTSSWCFSATSSCTSPSSTSSLTCAR